tara:strand:- start:228 stop:773 length:546 start_codon:yes stop_codon:yes gene_type:complete
MINKIIYKKHTFEKYISNEEIKDRCKIIASEINEKYRNQSVLFIGILNGSFPFMSTLLEYIDLDYKYDFIKISSYEGTKSKELKIYLDINKNIVMNENVIVVEDIVDSGKTIKFIKNKIKNFHPKSLNVATLLVKSNVIKIIDWYGFIIDDKFVIGYGLDLDNNYRNLKDIYIKIEKEKTK